MNQNQNASFESYEDDRFRTPVDVYIGQLTRDTHNGRISWRKSRSEAGIFEHTWGRVVVRLSYDIDVQRHIFTLSIRKAGDFRTQPRLVAQHNVSTSTLHEDELENLWQAIREYIDKEDSNLISNYIDDYMKKTKSCAFADELNSIIEDACRDIINLAKEQKIEK